MKKDNAYTSIVKASEARARRYLETAPRCDVCKGTVLAPGRTRHYLCDPDALEGRACTCRNGCSVNAYGDGSTTCDPRCAPCRIRKGQVLRKRSK